MPFIVHVQVSETRATFKYPESASGDRRGWSDTRFSEQQG